MNLSPSSTTLLSQRSHPEFYDAWEGVGEDERRERTRSNLANFVRFCRENSSVLRERLDGYDPLATHPLKSVPVMTSDELREWVPPTSFQLLSRDTRDFTVFQSGGTTGFPKSTLFSHDELELLNLGNARGFFAMGLSETDRVGNLFAVGGLYMTFVHINRMLQQYGCMNFPFSNHTAVDFLHTAVRVYQINCLAGITSVVLSALRGFVPMGLEGIGIQKVFYGGEHIYDADRAELSEKFGVELVGAPGYGTVDSWYVGYQCAHSPPGVFHVHDDQCFTEIVDEETGNNVEQDQIGLLYATPVVRRLTPVLRYRVGDRAQWVKDLCPCGRQTPRFRLLGRGDDVLRIGYDSVDYNFVQSVIANYKELSGSVQMVKSRVNGRDELSVLVETDMAEAGLGARVAQDLVSRRPTLRDHIDKGTVCPLKVRLVAPGSLERNARTGKLIRIKDVF